MVRSSSFILAFQSCRKKNHEKETKTRISCLYEAAFRIAIFGIFGEWSVCTFSNERYTRAPELHPRGREFRRLGGGGISIHRLILK